MAADPVAVVLKDMFFQNAFPYLEVRRPFILGTQQKQWRHASIASLKCAISGSESSRGCTRRTSTA